MAFSQIRLKNKAYHQYLISKDQDDFFVSTKHGNEAKNYAVKLC